MVSIRAFDSINAAFPGLSDGDYLLAIFDRPTNTPSVDSKEAIDNLFAFSAALGADYNGYWRNNTALQITILNATGAASPKMTRVGVLTMTGLASGQLKRWDYLNR